MKLIVIVPMKGSAQEPRLVQFILENEQEMERFANFYGKNNPTIMALLDVLLGKTLPAPEEPQPPPKTISLQITEGTTVTEKTSDEEKNA